MFDLNILYEQNKVCTQCFTLYEQVRELKIVQEKFNQALGIVSQSDGPEAL